MTAKRRDTAQLRDEAENPSYLFEQLREAEKIIASQQAIIHELKGYNTLLNRVTRMLIFFVVIIIVCSVYRAGGLKNFLRRSSTAVEIVSDSINSGPLLSSDADHSVAPREHETIEIEAETVGYESDAELCDLLQHYDKKFGAGIYAGMNIENASWLQSVTGMHAPFANFEGTVLNDFIEGHNETYGLITLGYALIFNHVPEWEDKMIEKLTSPDESSFFFYDGWGASDDAIYTAARGIARGDQIFSFYGSEWFRYRPYDEISPRAVGGRYFHMEDPYHAPSRIPGCPTMSISVENGTLRTRRPFAEGEVIEIARALLVPVESMLRVGPVDSFVWWPADYDSSHGVPHVLRNPPESSSPDGWPYIIPSGRFVVLLLGYGALYAAAGGPPLSDPNQHEDKDNNHRVKITNVSSLQRAGSTPGSTARRAPPKEEQEDMKTVNQGREKANVAYRWWAPEPETVGDDEDDEVGNNEVLKATTAARPPHINMEKKDLTTIRQIYGNIEQLLSDKTPIPRAELEGGTQLMCSERMFVEFTAARDIEAGEVLSIDLIVDEATRHRQTTSDFSRYCL